MNSKCFIFSLFIWIVVSVSAFAQFNPPEETDSTDVVHRPGAGFF
jgi:hypothetical protein